MARKANQPTLTRKQIVAAALRVVDAEGLSALTMRRLASELSITAMSLYYHVPDKSALYDLILDAVMSEIDLGAAECCAPLDERLIAAGHATRDALLAHPHAVPLALSRSLRTEAQLRPFEALLGMLFEGGFSATDAMGIANIIGQYVFGTAAAAANRVPENELHDAEKEADVSGLDMTKFPHLARAATEADYVGFDGDFDRGLRALVRGLLEE